MNFMPTKLNKREFLIVLVLLQLMVYVTVFIDISICRQVLGFLYLTFLPGFIILKLLKLGEFDWAETVLFSAGLSIVFLMSAGILLNELGSLFGFSRPLSVLPLMIILNGVILIGGVLVYLKHGNVEIWHSEPIKISPFLLLFLCLPILCIVGSVYVNIHGNNLLLLFLIIAVSLLFIVSVLSEKLLSPAAYPFAVLMIAIALLYHSSLISNYIIPFGSDVHYEYFVFKYTQKDAYWNSTPSLFEDLFLGRMQSMLSITVLPTIYSNLLNIDSMMFKTMFPLIFSLVPLGLYQIWSANCGKKYAFVSAFLFMALQQFYTEMLGLHRQMIAELFFVLLLLIVLKNRMKTSGKTICYMLFSFGIISSHYGLSEIFLVFILFVFIFLLLAKQTSYITPTMIAIFFTFMFSWYIFTSGADVFRSFLEFGDRVYRQFGDFLNPTSRGKYVLRGLGFESPLAIWNTISRAFAYATEVLILIGFIGLLTKRVGTNIKGEYFSFSFMAIAFLAALILVPGLANTLNMTRFYHILLFFLSPLFVFGAEFLVKKVIKQKHELVVFILTLVILVPYFLFQTDFVYEITGNESWSIPLSKYRMNAIRLYGLYGCADEYSVYGAQWVSKNVDLGNSKLYADGPSREFLLTIYGMIYTSYTTRLSNITTVVDNGVVYLSRLNVVEGVILSEEFMWNTSELSNIFGYLDIVYANGGSKIYQSKT